MRKIILYLLFLLSLFSVLGFSQISSYVSEKRPIISCQQWGFNRPQVEKSYTYPEKLVVRPWRGPHNVYALFVIPSESTSDNLFTVTIPGNSTYCGRFQDIGKVSSGVDGQKYYTLIRGYLNTRIALKLIAQGKLNQLQEPDNWRLGYVKR
ncbi:hypothetical protein [Nodularia sp. NIES-3585]|uniref:hypothetical protein n=1 Tax=Nodularia sp. NIES-3585 TaxID=1973477 RepID=UPI000B5C1D82|nr:hypothetical protein [Nodularia sp. NIES-3585]GAX34981.1 hypothetical protein NIES3585_09860 [Nodularia sp. NIES-3585]